MRIAALLRSLLVFAAILTFCAGPALAQTAGDNPAMYRGPDREQRLIEGAKKEGVINIYSSITVDDMKVISAGFEKKYGVKLQAWRASSEVTFSQLNSSSCLSGVRMAARPAR